MSIKQVNIHDDKNPKTIADKNELKPIKRFVNVSGTTPDSKGTSELRIVIHPPFPIFSLK